MPVMPEMRGVKSEEWPGLHSKTKRGRKNKRMRERNRDRDRFDHRGRNGRDRDDDSHRYNRGSRGDRYGGNSDRGSMNRRAYDRPLSSDNDSKELRPVPPPAQLQNSKPK